MVENIEELRTELDLYGFRYLSVPDERKVRIPLAKAGICVTPDD